MSPDLARVGVHSPEFGRSANQMRAASSDLAAARVEQRRVADRQVSLVQDRSDAAAKVSRARAEQDATAGAVRTAQRRLDARRVERQAIKDATARARSELRRLAIAAYVGGSDPPLISLVSNVAELSTQGKKRTLFSAASDRRIFQIHARLDALRRAQRRVHDGLRAVSQSEEAAGRAADRLTAGMRHRDAIDAQIADNTVQARAALQATMRREMALSAARTNAADDRVLSTVDGADFPLVALDAYWRAAHTAPCRIEWWGLAGISRVESGHGTAQGSSLAADGETTKAIIGIPLDGQGGTALIGDTDGGLLDQDPLFDRAVGPMQFIPSTWARWASDGNGDLVNDPQNIYDVAVAAARYLCFGRLDLTTDPGLRAGYFSYNQSPPYVDRVLSEAHGYQTSVSIPPPMAPASP